DAPAEKEITADTTFTAKADQKPEYTDDEVIPYLPDEDEPTKGSDDKDIPDNYITVTFKSEDEAKGTVKVGEKTGAVVKAKVKPGTNLEGKATALAKEGYGFTVWDPELGVAADGNEYTAKFIKSGDEVKPNDPIPEGWFRVTVKQDATSIAENTVIEKTYAVAPNDKLAADKFPSLEGKAAEGYENPAWYVGEEKVDAPAEKEITADTTFTAKAGEIATADKDNYDPHYENKTGIPGEKVEIPAPTFTKEGEQGTVPAPSDGDKKTTFAKNDKNQTNVTVDPNTGKVTVEIPNDAKVGTKITVPVDVTYPDGSKETVDVEVTVGEDKTKAKYPDTEIEKGNTETVTPKVTDKDGKPVDESKVGTPTVTNESDLPDGVIVNPKENGKVDITVPSDYNGPKDITVKVTVPVDGKDVESEIKVSVKDKTTPTPQEPSVTYPDTSIDKGETKKVTPEIKGKDGKTTKPDTTPEVVQPGNGVIVTPNKDGSIDVTVPNDYDGPGTITVDVTVRVDGKDINTTLTVRINSGEDDSHRPEQGGGDIFDGLFKRHDYTPTYPVKTVVPGEVTPEIFTHEQYIFGYPDDTIRPDGDMTRAEAIAVVARLQKLDLSDKTSNIYKDTKAGMWYNAAINAAFREGYLLEKEGENIRPNDKITRAELALLISHIDKKNDKVAPFEDVKGHKFEDAINQAYGNERIKGYPDGTFKPDNSITRAEVATMLNKLYDRYPDKDYIDANQNLVHNYKDMSYKGHWGYYELVEAYHNHKFARLANNMEEWKAIIK
ncbi:MAG: YPDG domain-containing protein, partial [Intestinibacter bartlettii]